ncbi:MAG: FHA domain-containing protein [Methylococcales bacterium]
MKNDTRDSATKRDNDEQKPALEHWLLDDDDFTELLPDENLVASGKSHINTDSASGDHRNLPFNLPSPFTLETPSNTEEARFPNVAPERFSTNPPGADWTLEKTLQINADDTMSASLVKIDSGEHFLLEIFPFEIGRSPQCQLQFANMSLSRQHAKIDKSETGLIIQDLESANGIQVNGIDVKQALLMDKDTVTLGHIHLRFELTSNESMHQKSGQYLIAKARLMRQYWKNFSAAGLVGLILLGSFFYKSRTVDRVMIVEQSTAPKVLTNRTVNRPSESVHPEELFATPNKTAQTLVTINKPNQHKPILDNLPEKISAQPELTVAKPDITLKTTSDDTLVRETITTANSESSSTSFDKKRSIVTAQSLINDARQLYQEGQVSKAISLLGGLSISSKISVKSQNQAANLETEITALENNYHKGKQSYSKGDKKQAWVIWKKFLHAENNLQLPAKSKYALAIQQHVMEESLTRGNALEKTDSKAAYRHLQRAALLNTESQVSKISTALEAKVRDIYSKGTQLERTNLTKAIDYWHQVTKIAPPSNEHYIKAKAKLRFYKEMSK